MMRIGRRGLLAAFGATVAAMGLRPRQADAVAATKSVGAATVRWLVDASLSTQDFASLPVVAPTRLDADLVQQWRDGLRDDLSSGRGAATALVRWDKAFVLQGLAREAGMQARVERLSPALFRVNLSARG